MSARHVHNEKVGYAGNTQLMQAPVYQLTANWFTTSFKQLLTCS